SIIAAPWSRALYHLSAGFGGNLERGRNCRKLAGRGEPVGGRDQGLGNPRLGRRVAGIRNDQELGLGPGFVQRPGLLRAAAAVVAPMDDHGWDVADLGHVSEQLAVDLEEALVEEIVSLDP